MCGCKQGTCPGNCQCGCRHTPPRSGSGLCRRLAMRVAIRYNRSCFLLGLSWSHHPSFPARLTHIYLGFWVLTIRTKSRGGVA